MEKEKDVEKEESQPGKPLPTPDQPLPTEVLERYLAGELGWKGESLPPEQMASALRALAGRLDPASPATPPSPATTPPPGILIQCASETHRPLLDATEAHHRRYAERWGLDFVCRRGAQQSERASYWDRIYLLLLALRQGRHELIFVLDADCLIQNVALDLRGVLPPTSWLGMVAYPPSEGRYPKSTVPYLHSGVMLVRRSQQALSFFEEVWTSGAAVEDDNTALLQLLHRDSQNLNRDSNRWREGIAVLHEAFNTPAHSPEASKAVIVGWHGQGTPQERAAQIAATLGMATPVETLPGQSTGAESQSMGAESQSMGAESQSMGAESRPFWAVANPMPEDPSPLVEFKKLLGRSAVVKGSLPELTLRPVGKATPDVKQIAAGKVDKALPDIQVLTGEETDEAPDEAQSAKRLLVYPWERFVSGGLVPAFGLADEIWARSRFERDTYVHLGIPAERVQVVLPGVDTTLFTPSGTRFTLPTSRRRRLLVLGPLTPEAGTDLTLAAYRQAFNRSDDVCLVVATNGEQGPLWKQLQQVEADPNGPDVLLLDDQLDAAGRAALCRSCHALVLVARRDVDPTLGLEAMACGLPLVVGVGGACDDFLTDESGFRVPVRWSLEQGAYWTEVDVRTLAEALQSVVKQPEQAERFGAQSRDQVEALGKAAHWQARMRTRLARLVEPPLPTPEPATLWAEPQIIVPKATASKTRSRKKAEPTTKKAETKIQLSLCMIARDEEVRIGACLDSIKPYVDEMILVDTGSKDRTREIALEHGARVFEFPWVDSFAEARNQSLAQARGEWIFWMDADDVIPEECGKKLRELIALHPNKDASYQVQVRIPPGEGEWSETVVDHVKLFPNSPDIRFEFRIHEQVMPALRRKGLQVLPSDVYVVHQHYDRSKEGQTKKRLRDFSLLELDLKERPNHPFILFNLGMTYLYATKEFEVAAQYLERCLALSHPQDSIVSRAYSLLTSCRIRQQRWQQACQANEAGRVHYPDDPELLYRAGQIYHELGKVAQSRLLLEQLVGGGDPPGAVSSVRNGVTGFRTFLGMFELAQANLALGRQDRAEALLRRTLRDYPHFAPARELLHRLKGEVEGPQRQPWPERPRVAVYYHAFLYKDWEPLVKEQLDRLVASGLHRRADRLVTGVVGSAQDVVRFLGLLPQGGGESGTVTWEVLGPGADDSKAEYKTLNRLHQEGIAGLYDAAWYFHTKGITRTSPGARTWRRYMEYFLLDRFEEGLKAFAQGWDTYGVEWKSPTPDGPWHHYSGNFWAARADYLGCLSPIVFANRFSCEDWIGHGNAKARCLHWSRVNLYETAYPEEAYRAKG